MSQTTNKPENMQSAEPKDSMESESGFRRWSRRKHEARIAAKQEAAAPSVTPAVDADDAVPAKVLTDADMPPVESLNENSDFSPFMSPGVSEALRQAALRRLFGSPQMNVLCELEGEFYDTAGLTPLGNIITYDMRAAMKRELEEAKAKAKEQLRDELTDDESEIASETTDTAPAASVGEVEAGADVATADDNKNLSSEKGVT